jgi:peptidoglycan/LPS O-acetylase OafA/YrhL
MAAGDFMLRRLVRLWPLYALGTAAAAAVAGFTHQSGVHIAAGLAFGAAFIPILWPALSMDGVSVFPLNIPAWSLFFELFANLVFAVVAPRLAWPVLAAILAFGAALLFFQTAHLPSIDRGVSIEGFTVGFGRVIWSFFAGVAVYRLWRMRKAPSVPLAACAVALLGMMAWGHHLLWAFVGFPLLVYLAAGAEPKGWSRAVQTRFGAASYGIYILQWPILLVAERHFRFDRAIEVIGLIVVVVTVALVMDRIYDGPARRWLGKVLSPLVRRRAATAT